METNGDQAGGAAAEEDDWTQDRWGAFLGRVDPDEMQAEARRQVARYFGLAEEAGEGHRRLLPRAFGKDATGNG